MKKLIIFFNDWLYRLKLQARFKTEMRVLLSKDQKKGIKLKVKITPEQATILRVLASYGIHDPIILLSLIENGLVKKSEINEAKRKSKRG